tara:strand:- start:140 stop:589 length:450 start_codon:yes stop_codon:yes gene_type:complete
LDEAGTAFHKSTSEQTLAPEDLAVFLIETVKTLSCGRLGREVYGCGSFRLHASSKFVTANSGLQLGIGFATPEVTAVEALKKVQLSTLAGAREAAWWVQVSDGSRAGFEKHALMCGGYEARSPATDAVYDHALGVFDYNEAWEVFVFCP